MSTRSKEAHLAEIKEAYDQIAMVRELIARTRRNVPMTSYTHERLARAENAALELRKDLWFTHEFLFQNGYDGETYQHPDRLRAEPEPPKSDSPDPCQDWAMGGGAR